MHLPRLPARGRCLRGAGGHPRSPISDTVRLARTAVVWRCACAASAWWAQIRIAGRVPRRHARHAVRGVRGEGLLRNRLSARRGCGRPAQACAAVREAAEMLMADDPSAPFDVIAVSGLGRGTYRSVLTARGSGRDGFVAVRDPPARIRSVAWRDARQRGQLLNLRGSTPGAPTWVTSRRGARVPVVVGMADRAVQEARQRVRSGIKSASYRLPGHACHRQSGTGAGAQGGVGFRSRNRLGRACRLGSGTSWADRAGGGRSRAWAGRSPTAGRRCARLCRGRKQARAGGDRRGTGERR